MANTFGGTIKLKGESEYQKALKGISNNLKVVGSEMKIVSAQYDKSDKSQKSLNAQSTTLNKRLSEQKEKVSVLKQALADAEKETGKNSDTTKKWQIALNNAQADVVKTTKELDNLGKELDEENQGFTVFKGVLANLGSSAIQSVVSGIKQIGNAVVDLGKQALNGYADFEQLSGGVKKLFGDDDYLKVLENANNSFKTSGLSANEYMEQVTSFSASLIKSLNGDTKQAVDLSDRIMRDMSDNANTFGTDISSIQNAYQRICKTEILQC